MRHQLLLILFAWVGLASAQVDHASVTGMLRDSSGAVVSGAKVQITHEATGVTRSVTSNGSGAYLRVGLPLGHAMLDATKSGFRAIHTEVDLNVGETRTLDFAFEVAHGGDSVQVVAEADLAMTSAAIGATYNNTQISELPLNGRNWGSMMTLTPGAVDTGAGNGGSVRFFGQRGDDVGYRVDGVDATSVRNQSESKSRLMISEDAIAEFRVNSQLYTAIRPTMTDELRIGGNYAQPLHSIPSGAEATISIPSLSSIPGGNRRIAFGISQSIVDQWAMQRGAHTLKAGVEIKRDQLIVHDFNLSDGTASYASLTDFQNDKLNTLAGSGELPTKQMRKILFFGYAQDEWKIRPNLTANIGLRYEFFNAFSEIHNRDIPFDVQGCGGYCPSGSAFANPPRLNFAPRLSLAWSPEAMKGKTVIRVGGGIFYGDAQLGDQYSPANNDAVRYTMTQASTPGLAYPFDPFINPNSALAAAPRSMPINHKNETSQQWGLQIQQALTKNINFQVGYNDQGNYHVFSRTYVNVINPLTKTVQFPNLSQDIDVRGDNGVSNFQGLVSTLQVNNLHSFLIRANYMYSHAINDGSAGGGSGNYRENVNCRSCERGNSDYDVRNLFNVNLSYQIPLGINHWYGGWQWSGSSTARGGLPFNISVTRAASTLADGNALSAQRPNLVPGQPLYLNYGSTGLWLNSSAFAVPAAGTWGNLGRDVLRAPGLFQIDTSVTKKTRVYERAGLEWGVELFNILNHPQLGVPSANISSRSNFGRITAPINTSPVGSGTPRQIQIFARISF